jgi:hypothetical protein
LSDQNKNMMATRLRKIRLPARASCTLKLTCFVIFVAVVHARMITKSSLNQNQSQNIQNQNVQKQPVEKQNVQEFGSQNQKPQPFNRSNIHSNNTHSKSRSKTHTKSNGSGSQQRMSSQPLNLGSDMENHGTQGVEESFHSQQRSDQPILQHMEKHVQRSNEKRTEDEEMKNGELKSGEMKKGEMKAGKKASINQDTSHDVLHDAFPAGDFQTRVAATQKGLQQPTQKPSKKGLQEIPEQLAESSPKESSPKDSSDSKKDTPEFVLNSDSVNNSKKDTPEFGHAIIEDPLALHMRGLRLHSCAHEHSDTINNLNLAELVPGSSFCISNLQQPPGFSNNHLKEMPDPLEESMSKLLIRIHYVFPLLSKLSICN